MFVNDMKFSICGTQMQYNGIGIILLDFVNFMLRNLPFKLICTVNNNLIYFSDGVIVPFGEYTFVLSSRGTRLLSYRHYYYCVQSQRNSLSTKLWRCSSYSRSVKCNARATVFENGTCFFKGHHCHPPRLKRVIHY